METQITHGVRVSVEPRFEPEHSTIDEGPYVFSYRIQIENRRDDTVQLMHRHWYIIDGLGQIREVEGPGVVGNQPILEPGQSYQYESWCPLPTEIGKMWGTYRFIRPADDMILQVSIPAFIMYPPFKAN